MARDRRVDEALQIPKRGIWIATVVIVLMGLLVLLWNISPTERRRHAILERTEVGDQANHVTEMIGATPVRCPAGDLTHLQRSFPDGWAQAAVDVALEQLAQGSNERWVYAVDRRRTASCTPSNGVTEVGVDDQGRVLWYVAITGKTMLRLPEELTPSGPSEERTDSDTLP